MVQRLSKHFHSQLYKCMTWICSWKDEDLNFFLISAIEKDEKIKQSLFLLPGANKSLVKEGSKPKTEYQWKLLRKIFKKHKKYKDVFALMKGSSEKSVWGCKIKNWFKRWVSFYAMISLVMVLIDFTCTRIMQDVCKYQNKMGETGAGITHKEEINMKLNNSFTNK